VGGPGLDAESITGVFSVTKGAAALALGTQVRSGAIDLDERVATTGRNSPSAAKERSPCVSCSRIRPA
jgi:CubicO group peptidase (beta-lactamase class C family)